MVNFGPYKKLLLFGKKYIVIKSIISVWSTTEAVEVGKGVKYTVYVMQIGNLMNSENFTTKDEAIQAEATICLAIEKGR